MNFDKYVNTLPFGFSSDSPKWQLCKHTHERFRYKKDNPEYCKECGVRIGDKGREVLEEHNKLIEAYNEEDTRLHYLFMKDLFEEFGVTDNPKKDKCFNLAWRYGHSVGFSEVYNYFSDFIELIK